MISKTLLSEPPFCCQPPRSDEEWAARTARIASAHKAAYERIPDRCPACGKAGTFPTFLLPNEYECADPACAAIWTVDR